MIDRQLDVYPTQQRFVHALLGLLSTCDTFVNLLRVERRDAVESPDGPLVDFALGVVSLTRTLRAVLSTTSFAPAMDDGETSLASAEDPAAALRWLR